MPKSAINNIIVNNSNICKEMKLRIIILFLDIIAFICCVLIAVQINPWLEQDRTGLSIEKGLTVWPILTEEPDGYILQIDYLHCHLYDQLSYLPAPIV